MVSAMSTATNGGDASYDALLSDAEFGGGDSTLITLGDGDGDTSVTGAGLLQVGESAVKLWVPVLAVSHAAALASRCLRQTLTSSRSTICAAFEALPAHTVGTA